MAHDRIDTSKMHDAWDEETESTVDADPVAVEDGRLKVIATYQLSIKPLPPLEATYQLVIKPLPPLKREATTYSVKVSKDDN